MALAAPSARALNPVQAHRLALRHRRRIDDEAGLLTVVWNDVEVRYPEALHEASPDYTHLRPEFVELCRKHAICRHGLQVLSNYMMAVDGTREYMYSQLMKVEDLRCEVTMKHGKRWVSSTYLHSYDQAISDDRLVPAVLADLPAAHQEYAQELDKYLRLQLYMHKLGALHATRVARGFITRARYHKRWWNTLITLAATAIQATFRMRIAVLERRRLAHVRDTAAATNIQRIYRALRGRRRAAMRALYLENLLENESAVAIQAQIRGFIGRRTAHRLYERLKDEHNRLLRHRMQTKAREEHAAALMIQKYVRGWFGRRQAYMLRQQDYLTNPRVRALADMYLARGDLWGLLAAINDDYEQVTTSTTRTLSH